MRKLLGSIVIGLALVVALMVFVNPSLADRVVGERRLNNLPPVEGRPEPGGPPDYHPAPLPRRARMVSIRGSIANLPSNDGLTGTWTITDQAGSTWTVTVTEETNVVPPTVEPQPGDGVQVIGTEEGDQALMAGHVVVMQRTQERARPVEVHGEIEKLPEASVVACDTCGEWVVGGYTVTVDAETRIHPPQEMPTVGMRANVIAFEQPDGKLWAKNIALHSELEREDLVEIEGVIGDLPDDPKYLGTWLVDGFTVTVTDTTDLKGATPALSLTAKVKGYELGDGAILAKEIVAKGAGREMLELEGTLVSFTDIRPSVWIIDVDPTTGTEEISFTVTVTTYVDKRRGELEEGCWVEVKALQCGDSLLALRIRVKDNRDPGPPWMAFEGTVVSTATIPGEWVIETISPTERITIEVTDETLVVPPVTLLELGASVRVRALPRPDDVPLAVWIKIDQPEREEVEFEGTVVSTVTVPGEWTIETETETLTVAVTTETVFIPDILSITVGSTVEVKALKEGDTLHALCIRLEDDENGPPAWMAFEGTVVSTTTVEGEWVIKIDGDERITITVNHATQIIPRRSSLIIGAEVEVKARELPDGTIWALWIKVENHGRP